MGATDPDVSVAKENLFKKVRSKEEKDRRQIEDGIEGQREHFDNHGLHIGYVYGDDKVPGNASLYERRFVKGARLPHVWLKEKPDVEWVGSMGPINSSYVKEFNEESLKRRQWSVLDLCAYDAFTLFAGKEDKKNWLAALEEAKIGLPTKLKVNIAVLNEDFQIVEGVKKTEWVTEMGLSEGGAVLVRPDQHILDVFGKVDSVRVTESLQQHLGL